MKTRQIVFTSPNTAELMDAEYFAPKDKEVTDLAIACAATVVWRC